MVSARWGDGGVFISYRREETATWAGRLYDLLKEGFGDGRVFMDVASIPLGAEFRKEIKEAVSKCNILLALIGPHWTSVTDSNGAKRIRDTRDYVRIEIETALQRNIRVVPVLVDGATLPKANELPPSLRSLTQRQELRLSNTGFRTEASLLVAAVAEVLEAEPDRAAAAGVTDKIEGYLTGVGNTRLYWQGWLPAGPTGVLLVCHGAYEHSGRYQNVADTLAPFGWAVYGLDLRGHGRSLGDRAHVDHFSDWVDDFDRFKCEVVSRHQDLPVFVLGHCLGAQIALAYALVHQEALRGLVLSAPFLATRAMPGAVRSLKIVVPRLFPRARFKLIGVDKISQDPEVVNRYRNDPHVFHGNATLKMARIVEQQFEILMERSRYLRVPVLIQHGAEDAIVDPDGSRRLERAVGSPDRTFILYEGLWNEIYNEPERQRPLNDLRDWLARHRSSPSTQTV